MSTANSLVDKFQFDFQDGRFQQSVDDLQLAIEYLETKLLMLQDNQDLFKAIEDGNALELQSTKSLDMKQTIKYVEDGARVKVQIDKKNERIVGREPFYNYLMEEKPVFSDDPNKRAIQEKNYYRNILLQYIEIEMYRGEYQGVAKPFPQQFPKESVEWLMSNHRLFLQNNMFRFFYLVVKAVVDSKTIGDTEILLRLIILEFLKEFIVESLEIKSYIPLIQLCLNYFQNFTNEFSKILNVEKTPDFVVTVMSAVRREFSLRCQKFIEVYIRDFQDLDYSDLCTKVTTLVAKQELYRQDKSELLGLWKTLFQNSDNTIISSFIFKKGNCYQPFLKNENSKAIMSSFFSGVSQRDPMIIQDALERLFVDIRKHQPENRIIIIPSELKSRILAFMIVFYRPETLSIESIFISQYVIMKGICDFHIDEKTQFLHLFYNAVEWFKKL